MAARGSGKPDADSWKTLHDTQLATLLAVGTTARKPRTQPCNRWFGRRASAAGTSATDREPSSWTITVDSAAQIRSPWSLCHLSISATSRPELGGRELVETAPKSRLLPARHVVCALLPEKHCLSFHLSRPCQVLLAQVSRQAPYSSPKYIRHRALSSEFIFSIFTPLPIHSFQRAHRHSPIALPGCSPLAHYIIDLHPDDHHQHHHTRYEYPIRPSYIVQVALLSGC